KMEVDNASPTGQSAVVRDKTAPFLIRTFVKIGSFHRLSLFEDATLPTTDEQQIFTWKDATLSEVLTTLRETAPHVPEYRHPLARFAFRTVYADSGNKGRFSQKELGLVYSRDILGEPGTLTSIAPRLLEEADNENREQTHREKEERTLDELRFVPGDFLLLA
ncbi:Sin3 associated polypeptide p18, partial [Lentinula novae-zelandiae]